MALRVAIALLVLAVAAAGCSSPEARELSATRPNIVVFLTDDQTVEQMRVMANVDELLVSRGATFENSFTNYPLCCPARATLLTGQHASNHGVLWNGGETGGYDNFAGQRTTLPVVLADAGYTTIHVGKYLNGYGLPPFLGGATELDDLRAPPGWDHFRGLVSPTEVYYFEPTFLDGNQLVTYDESSYVTDVVTDLVIESLEAASTSDEPFFVQVGYSAPHAQAGLPLDEVAAGTFFERLEEEYPNLPFVEPVPAPRHAGTFADEPFLDSPSIGEADVDDKPAALRYPELTDAQTELLAGIYRSELESLLAVDESVAAIVEALDRLGELETTYLVFTSDNGYLHGEHRIWPAKYYPYEESVRVPLVIAGPGIEEGTSIDSVVSNVDLAPTFFDLAGAVALRDPDGRSLLGLLEESEQEWSRAIFLEGHAPEGELLTFGGRTAPGYVGVHTGDALYVEYDDGTTELYDLSDDPYQLENLAGHSEHEELETRLRAYLRALESCAGPPCRTVGSG